MKFELGLSNRATLDFSRTLDQTVFEVILSYFAWIIFYTSGKCLMQSPIIRKESEKKLYILLNVSDILCAQVILIWNLGGRDVLSTEKISKCWRKITMKILSINVVTLLSLVW